MAKKSSKKAKIKTVKIKKNRKGKSEKIITFHAYRNRIFIEMTKLKTKFLVCAGPELRTDILRLACKAPPVHRTSENS